MEAVISANMEDYLETIHLIEQDQGNARVKDIADKMNISRASVSGAMKNLEKQGLVSHPRYDLISLTSKGDKIAKQIYARHVTLMKFLQDVLGLDKETAEKDACRIEHNISPRTFKRLKVFVEESMNP
ncbi:metal-dependent transcriptional regulator [candidate division KSB1 bacterium]|nr:metal-dependent transcriptional regulator [candidate division KSB1 bacterium]